MRQVVEMALGFTNWKFRRIWELPLAFAWGPCCPTKAVFNRGLVVLTEARLPSGSERGGQKVEGKLGIVGQTYFGWYHPYLQGTEEAGGWAMVDDETQQAQSFSLT